MLETCDLVRVPSIRSACCRDRRSVSMHFMHGLANMKVPETEAARFRLERPYARDLNYACFHLMKSKSAFNGLVNS